MHRPHAVLLALVLVISLPGCSTVQQFHLLLTVVNAADGTPVPGVKVTLDDLGVEEHQLDMAYGSPHDGATDEAGRFAYDFLISPYPCDAPRWYLKVSKTGFEPVVIDIKPSPQPPRSRERIVLTRTVELRPQAGAD